MALAAAGLLACGKPPAPPPLDAVLERGRITLITRNAPATYYLDRETPAGFEYELARAFADYLGVDLDVELAADWPEMRRKLGEIPAAFLAPGRPISPEAAAGLTATAPYLSVRHHIILGPAETEMVRTPSDLAGRTVHLAADARVRPDLEALRAEGVPFSLAVHDDVPTEELIRRVAAGELPAAAAPGHVALLNRRYYPETAIAAAVGEPAPLRWLARAEGEGLRRRMDAFFRAARETGAFQRIHDRHFGPPPPPENLDVAAFLDRMETAAAPHLPRIRAAARAHGFDWRLIAAQAYQESRFDPAARSPAGAVGLLQLMPDTARKLGVADRRDPAANIEGGVRHLRGLVDFFDGARSKADRLRIALAAYNAGQGHILDARNLARQRGLDPDRWESLTETLPLLREERHYRDALHGYCRCAEPVEYVGRIMAYADVLRREAIVEAAASRP
jgi:membrane-bound lytic murein transglycosylase F